MAYPSRETSYPWLRVTDAGDIVANTIGDTITETHRRQVIVDELRAGCLQLPDADDEHVVSVLEEGRRWFEPYVNDAASVKDKAQGLVLACAYWHAVAEQALEDRDRALRSARDADDTLNS